MSTRLPGRCLVSMGLCLACVTVCLMGEERVETDNKTADLKVLTIGEAGKCATETFAARQVVRRGDTSYIVYPNYQRGKWVVLCRSLDHKRKALSKPVLLCKGTDDHTIPATVMDSKSNLHVVSGGHGPLHYIKTLKPLDIRSWSKPTHIGSGTYPQLLIDKNDTMYLLYRGPGLGNLAFQKKTKQGRWTKPAVIGKTNGPFFYIMSAALGSEPAQPSIHVVGHFYYRLNEPLPGNRDWKRWPYGYRIRPWYIVSRDGGKTWEKADGSKLKLPFDDLSVDVLFDLDEPYDISWSVDVAIDEKNRPHVVCLTSSRTTPLIEWWRRTSPRTGKKAHIEKAPSTMHHLVWKDWRWTDQPVVFGPLTGEHLTHSTIVRSGKTCHIAVVRNTLGKNTALWHLWSTEGCNWRGRKISQARPGEGFSEPKWKLPDSSGDLELIWTRWHPLRPGKRPGQGGWTLLYQCIPVGDDGAAGARRLPAPASPACKPQAGRQTQVGRESAFCCDEESNPPWHGRRAARLRRDLVSA